MMDSNFTIKAISDINFQEVLNLVSENGFLPSVDSPYESSLASVFEFQKTTNNYNFEKMIALYDDEQLVGVLFLLVFELQYKNKIYPCVQGSSGYVKPNYRGVFKHFLKKMLEMSNNAFLLFMFSAPAVHKTASNNGFVEVCKNQFVENKYILVKPFSFINSSINNAFLKSFSKLFVPLDKLLFRLKSESKIKIIENTLFEGDYSIIEKDYNTDYFEKLVPVWNRDVLKNKYKKTTLNIDTERGENASFHFVALNNKNEIIGSLVVRKIANYNRLVIVELYTSISDRRKIVKSFESFLINKAYLAGYEAIMYNGIGEEYETLLSRKFFKLSKKSNLKVFFKSNIKEEILHVEDKIKFFYSTDDVNF
jgi:hypothetical protein